MTSLHFTRRQTLAATVGLGVGAVGTVARTGASKTKVSGSWPFGRGTVGNTGQTQASGPTSAPSVRWTFDEHLVSRKPPVVSDGNLYVGYFDDSAVFASLDAATGEERWSTDLGESTAVRFPEHAAAIGDDVVIAPFGYLLFGFDPADGTERWRTELGESVHAPVLADGTGYTSVRSEGTAVAFDPATGSVEWETSVGGWTPGGAAVVDGTVYAVGNSENQASAVVALDAGTGDVQWRREVDHGLVGPPAVSGDSVYVSHAEGVHALRRADGTVRWSFDARSVSESERHNFRYTGSAPAVGSDAIYVGMPDNRVYAIDAATGSKRWEFWTWHNVTGDPVVGGDTVYVGSDDTFIYALNTETGERRWEFDTTGRIDGAGGAVVDGMLYVSTWEDGLYALEGGR